MLSGHHFAQRPLARLILVLLVTIGGSGQLLATQDSSAVPASAESLRVWQFRGINPGTSTDSSVLADKRWGEPFDRSKLSDGRETWHYPMEGNEAILVIHQRRVQVVELMLREGTELNEVLSAFRFQPARQAGELPAVARRGIATPPEWKPMQVAEARVVIFVDTRPPVPLARQLRFYGPDPPLPPSFTNTIGMTLNLIPAGNFRMGSSESGADLEAAFQAPAGRFSDEQPEHQVRITRPYYMAIHEVTVGQFRQFIRETGHLIRSQRPATGQLSDRAEFAGATWFNPGFRQTDLHPVVSVSWEDAVAFCRWLSQKEGREYRLPTEAEWEYACRAGTASRYHHGDDPLALVQVANVLDLAAESVYPQWKGALAADDGYAHTSPIGSFQPNAFGLHDMHGNVWEWCQDWYESDYYRKSPAQDPTGPATGELRLFRGGCWY